MKQPIEWIRNAFTIRTNSWRNSCISSAGILAKSINIATGYDVCERLRESVFKCDESLSKLKSDLSESRVRYRKAVSERSSCQKEINNLLQRKSEWKDTELNRFTELYRREMNLDQKELETKVGNELLEKQVDQAHQELINAMRERYQEEQLWSDKIRRASTLGTFGLMFLNLVLFLVLQLWVEPRKRRKLVNEVVNSLKDSGKIAMLK